MRWFGRRTEERADREAAAYLAGRALIEIRYLAGRPGEDTAEALRQIRFLADLAHNMPGIAGGGPGRCKDFSRREAAMAARPMSWTWETTGPKGRAWMLARLAKAGRSWTPPPPLPTPRKGVTTLSARQRVGLLRGWPVKAPPGHRPLPRHARRVKAVDTETVAALKDEAERHRFGMGGDGRWWRAHLDPDAVHHLVPDPAPYYWPDPEHGRPWWQCRSLVRMIDGEEVTTSVAVLPATFAALPSDVSRLRLRGRALVRVMRAVERDTYLWRLDHQCTPDGCGYEAETGEWPC
ncbi:hypothetical protein [Actinomadura algeriensis]|uniref:Uncharacterized protein n=1 Tax=Actinomadura algeriensis TaxID=1679523 RepID=A0ABR9JLG4_9ACTN|nr:hypothetical protein [Actinomadura algeriensis]MBE1530955.1 hypothetical protein [Actinomadura algeriensis]